MKHLISIFLIVAIVEGGPNDTLDQLKAAITNVLFEDQIFQAPLVTELGSVPDWLSGSLVRHACGVLGETDHPSSQMVNRVTHLFDCLSMGQSYTFHQGKAMYSSKFYETNQVDIWLTYDQNMNQSSIWWGTVYAKRNLSAMAKEGDNMYKPGKPSQIANVAWWQIGDKVIATTESPSDQVIDIHNLMFVENYGFSNGDWLGPGFRDVGNPSHEAYGPDGIVWSTAAAFNPDTGENKRVVYKIDPISKTRDVVGEFKYAAADLALCLEPGFRYPDPDARLRQMHSLQTTESFVILAENNYMYDPCERIFYDDSLPHYPQTHSFESDISGRIIIMDKNGTTVGVITDIPAMFVTHVLGSYEDHDTNTMHFDLLQYADASPYTHWTDTDIIASGEMHTRNFTQVVRYSVNMESWTLIEMKNLAKNAPNSDFEFSNINPLYYNKPYKYAYMSRNVFTLNGAVVKLNVDDGSMITKELPDGLFPTEPIFVSHPNPVSEDDGVILMSGVDGGKEKGFLMIYNATNMDIIYHGTAPKMSLLGLHSKFFPFSVGCSQDDCTPNIEH